MRRVTQSCVRMWIAAARTMRRVARSRHLLRARRAANRTCRKAGDAALMWHRGRRGLTAHQGHLLRALIVRRVHRAVEVALRAAAAATTAKVAADLVTWNEAGRSTRSH